MVNLSKTETRKGCNPWFILCLVAASATAAIFYGQHKESDGFNSGVSAGACYWELTKVEYESDSYDCSVSKTYDDANQIKRPVAVILTPSEE